MERISFSLHQFGSGSTFSILIGFNVHSVETEGEVDAAAWPEQETLRSAGKRGLAKRRDHPSPPLKFAIRISLLKNLLQFRRDIKK